MCSEWCRTHAMLKCKKMIKGDVHSRLGKGYYCAQSNTVFKSRLIKLLIWLCFHSSAEPAFTTVLCMRVPSIPSFSSSAVVIKRSIQLHSHKRRLLIRAIDLPYDITIDNHTDLSTACAPRRIRSAGTGTPTHASRRLSSQPTSTRL